MPNADPSRSEIFRLSRIRFAGSVGSLGDFDFVVRLYTIFLHRTPEFSTFEDPLNTLALRASYTLQVMNSVEAHIVHNHNYYHLLESFARALGYTAITSDVATIIENSYSSMEALMKDAAAIANVIEENSAAVAYATREREPVDPAQPDAPYTPVFGPVPPALFAGTAPDIVGHAFETLLKRSPTEDELDHCTARLRTGELDFRAFLSSLVESEEFGSRALMHTSTSRHLAGTVISTLMQRDPGDDAINIYAGAIQNGYALDNFLKEMVGSPEFQARMGVGAPARAAAMASREDDRLGKLAEGLIVAHLATQGCAFPIPPRDPNAPSVSPERIRSMMHTLALFGQSTASDAPS